MPRSNQFLDLLRQRRIPRESAGWNTTFAVGRSHREAPEIDGIVHVPEHLAIGELHDVVVAWADGPDVGVDGPDVGVDVATSAAEG